MSELTQAVAEAGAMEAASLRIKSELDAALVQLEYEREMLAREEARHFPLLRTVAEASDMARRYLGELETALKERDEARNAKAQIGLRWQAAEKECAALRAELRDKLQK